LVSGKGENMGIGKPMRIDKRKRITLPNEVMDILDLQKGDYITFVRVGNEIAIRKVKLVEVKHG